MIISTLTNKCETLYGPAMCERYPNDECIVCNIDDESGECGDFDAPEVGDIDDFYARPRAAAAGGREER